ncbi:MAG: hypothetical protein K2M60_10765 [Lachnospiraceae bacterium]|nr:hypothetical protein [Lachnospiraceae bacterium]
MNITPELQSERYSTMQYSTIQYNVVQLQYNTSKNCRISTVKGKTYALLMIFKAASIVTGGIANIKSLRPFTGWRLIFFKGGKCSVRKSIHKS